MFYHIIARYVNPHILYLHCYIFLKTVKEHSIAKYHLWDRFRRSYGGLDE